MIIRFGAFTEKEVRTVLRKNHFPSSALGYNYEPDFGHDVFKSRDLTRYDFVVGFFAQANEWKISMRGAGKDIDLGAIAKDFGGGGHKDAAGFYVKTFSDLQRILPLR